MTKYLTPVLLGLLALTACQPSQEDIKKQVDAKLPAYKQKTEAVMTCLQANNMDRFKCEKEMNELKTLDEELGKLDPKWNENPANSGLF